MLIWSYSDHNGVHMQILWLLRLSGGFKVTFIPNHEANQGWKPRALKGFTPYSVLKRIAGDGLIITACRPDLAAATGAHIPVVDRVP